MPSIHGRALSFDASNIYLYGRPINGTNNPVGMGRGKTIYVDSSIAGTDGTSPSTALATIDSAFDKCTANEGDVVVVLPKHAETITAAGGITCDVAGVSIIGLGYGNQRPTITFGTANTATVLVTAAGVFMQNLIFTSNFLAVATGIGVTATDFWIDNCSFKNSGSSKNFTNPINCTGTTSNTADGLRVTNCRWVTNGDTAGGAFIKTAGTAAYWVITDNYVDNPATATAQLVSVATGKILTDARISWNVLINAMTANELFISNDGTTNTGVIDNNYVGHADVTGTHDAGWDAGGFRLFNNQSTSVDNLQGLLIPAADVNL